MNKNMTLFKVYLLAGTFTFSGGMAMIPVIERELCDKLNLITVNYSGNKFPGF
ncbi:chromate transporter [Paucilactobacillus nenjiangensis]|uniref:chromate transporter n=1 Tax=Paucilactobacillus nenjiangensis TaxID=1296540 RepID=UPI003FA32C72